MRMHRKLELSHSEDWVGFEMRGDKLVTPIGQLVTPQQVITGLALLEIQSELEIKTTSKLLRYARALAKLM